MFEDVIVNIGICDDNPDYTAQIKRSTAEFLTERNMGFSITVLNKDYETKLKIKLLEQQNENAFKNIENSQAFVREMRAVKHDIKNQFLTIYRYINNGDTEEAKAYIKNLSEEYLPNVQQFITTDNMAFDAIINAKIAICNQKKIYMEVKAMQNSIKNIETADIVTLFGNLLDNSIEAVENLKQKRICVNIENKGEYLSILVSNTIEKSVLEYNKNLETSKKDKVLHGIGIKSIRSIVKKYNGMIDFFEENNEFCCHIMLDVNNYT